MDVPNYSIKALHDEGPRRKYPRVAVLDPDGVEVRKFTGTYAITDARNHATRLARMAKLPVPKI